MCCDNKCLFFIKVRTGSLIFGYIAAVLSAIGVLICIGQILFYIFQIFYVTPLHYTEPLHIWEIMFFEVTTGFTCTVLLLHGITKNKPVLVKTYIIYGMIHLVLLLIIVVIILFTCLPVFGIIGLLLCGIYTMCIYMVYLTYKIIITEVQSERRSFTNAPNLLMA